MLINKAKYTAGDIVSFKISTGEEILGSFKDEDMMGVTLEKPLMLAMTKNGPAMAPIMMTVAPDTTLTFGKNNIIVGPVETDKEIADQYRFQTTGIQLASAGSIIS